MRRHYPYSHERGWEFPYPGVTIPRHKHDTGARLHRLARVAGVCLIVFLLDLFAISSPSLAVTLDKDTTWNGQISLAEDLTVPAGVILTVAPGSVIRFAAGIGLVIHGTLSAIGEEKHPIVFTAIDRHEPGAWNEILFYEAGDSSLVHCDFSYATWGVHSHFTKLQVLNCRFHDNEGGIRFRRGFLQIKGSVFEHNKIGIRSFQGAGIISGNTISTNEIGIFVREKGDLIKINLNNILNNERFDLRLGDFNLEDVDARENWWGGKPNAVKIFDGDDESYIGRVNLTPYRETPVTLRQEYN